MAHGARCAHSSQQCKLPSHSAACLRCTLAGFKISCFNSAKQTVMRTHLLLDYTCRMLAKSGFARCGETCMLLYVMPWLSMPL